MVNCAVSRTTQVLVLAGARRCVLVTCGKKKCELRFYARLNLYIMCMLDHNWIWKMPFCLWHFFIPIKPSIYTFNLLLCLNQSIKTHVANLQVTIINCSYDIVFHINMYKYYIYVDITHFPFIEFESVCSQTQHSHIQ